MRRCEQLFSVLGRATRLFADLRRGKRQYQTSWCKLLGRIAYLRRHGGFRPREALLDGLLDVRIPESALAAVVSKPTLVELQARVNPVKLVCLTDNKAIFHAYCASLNLPVPRLFGVAAHPAGYSAAGHPLATPADWQQFVAGLPEAFVVKPCQGVYGRGVEVFQRSEGGFNGSLSGWHSADEMHNAFFTDARYSSFLIQERLHPHPQMQALCGSPYLQTLRIVTYVDGRGASRVVLAFLRIITGDAVVDNYDGGSYGNLLSLVDPATGTLNGAFGPGPGGIGVVPVPQHPRTGVPIQGFRLPDWEAACALAERAALLFLPNRTLGWDIALTGEGPRIVEANEQWDPCNELMAHAQDPALVEKLLELLAVLRHAPRR